MRERCGLEALREAEAAIRSEAGALREEEAVVVVEKIEGGLELLGCSCG